MAIRSKGVHASKGKLDFYHYYQQDVAAAGARFSKYLFPETTDWASRWVESGMSKYANGMTESNA